MDDGRTSEPATYSIGDPQFINTPDDGPVELAPSMDSQEHSPAFDRMTDATRASIRMLFSLQEKQPLSKHPHELRIVVAYSQHTIWE